MAYINTVSFDESDGDLKEIYEKLVETRGKIAEVHKIHSLNPQVLVAHMDLYMKIMFGKSPLKRYQREMLGVVVSAKNNCSYCINHHQQALLAYWKDEGRTEMLYDSETRKNAGLSDAELLLCRFADELTSNDTDTYEERVESLKEMGVSDREILDAVQVIAYFNFVNRMVLGLGVTYTEDEIKGYKY